MDNKLLIEGLKDACSLAGIDAAARMTDKMTAD
jgi:hypothetical protein